MQHDDSECTGPTVSDKHTHTCRQEMAKVRRALGRRGEAAAGSCKKNGTKVLRDWAWFQNACVSSAHTERPVYDQIDVYLALSGAKNLRRFPVSSLSILFAIDTLLRIQLCILAIHRIALYCKMYKNSRNQVVYKNWFR